MTRGAQYFPPSDNSVRSFHFQTNVQILAGEVNPIKSSEIGSFLHLAVERGQYRLVHVTLRGGLRASSFIITLLAYSKLLMYSRSHSSLSPFLFKSRHIWQPLKWFTNCTCSGSKEEWVACQLLCRRQKALW